MIAAFIDPGYELSGWCVCTFECGRLTTLESGDESNDTVCSTVSMEVCQQYQKAGVIGAAVRLGVERVILYRGKPASNELLGTAFWSGVFYSRLQHVRGLVESSTVKIPTRPQILSRLAGNPSASKGELSAALYARFGKPGTKKNPGLLYGLSQHQRDALAGCLFVADA